MISEQLRLTLEARGHRPVVVAHGFAADLRAAFDTARPDPGVAALPGPRLGYAGTIDGRLAFDALAALADDHPGGSLVLVGPVSPRLARGALDALAARPNVHVLGPVPREQVPAVLAALDCLLMPYVEDEWGRHGSPLKLWDYLYAGPPIAGCGYRVLAAHPPPLVHFASPPARLGEAVHAALAEATSARAARRAHALANTWDDRAAQLGALAARLLAERGQRAP